MIEHMNKMIRSLFIGAVGVMGLTACYDDNSSMGDSMTDITLGELEDRSAISYIGQQLEVHPQVAGYSDNELDYAWYLLSNEESENGYRENKIADTKDLSYEVNLASGTYVLVFEATHRETGLVRTTTMKLNVSTSFSRGYYLLKETADGNTELDMINANGVAGNLMTNVVGSPMQGKPRNLSVIYSGEYIDTDINKTAVANMIHLFTEKNDYRGFRTEDLKQTFDKSNLFYSGTMEESEQPVAMINVVFCVGYLSNTGLRSYTAYGAMGMDACTGRFGYPVGTGASKFIQYSGLSIIYWNAQEHAVYKTDYNVSSANEIQGSGDTEYPSDLDCIASGVNYVAGSTNFWFLCTQASTGDRYLLLLSNSRSIKKVIKLDASTHLAKNSVIAGNVFDATYIYSAEGDKVYAYSWETETEMEVPLPGFTTGEEITYLSCPFLNLASSGNTSQDFRDFVIATKKGTGYKVYLYHQNVMNGGVPIGNPEIVEGENGVIRCMRYVSSLSLTYDCQMNAMMGGGPVYPYTD